MERSAVRLVGQLDWRLRLLAYGLEHLGSDSRLADEEQIRSDLGMLVLECRQIMEQRGGGEDRHGEGPLGPLPKGLFDGREG